MVPIDESLNSDSYPFTATFKLLSSQFSFKNIHIKMAKFWLSSLRMLSDPLCLHLPKLVGEQSLRQVGSAVAPSMSNYVDIGWTFKKYLCKQIRKPHYFSQGIIQKSILRFFSFKMLKMKRRETQISISHFVIVNSEAGSDWSSISKL